MDHVQAMARATRIARFLVSGSETTGRRPVREQSLIGTLAVMQAAENMKAGGRTGALSPKIEEIILFGSAARGESLVNDIDMMIFDYGFYSNVLVACNDERSKTKGCRNMYFGLGKNLERMIHFFGFDSHDPEVNDLLIGEKTDLHVLPIDLLTDPHTRKSIAANHLDPNFFENAFGCLFRFNRNAQVFEPITIEELRGKYSGVTSEESVW